MDDGIQSVRLARDSRDEPRLMDDVAFWRKELAMAAAEVTAYADAAAALHRDLRTRLLDLAKQKGIAAERGQAAAVERSAARGVAAGRAR